MHTGGDGPHLLLLVSFVEFVLDEDVARALRQEKHLVLGAVLNDLLPLHYQLLLWSLEHGFHSLDDIFEHLFVVLLGLG